ncbi:MAG: hypothetical protein QM488_08980 [Rhizobiaceae bacterium]
MTSISSLNSAALLNLQQSKTLSVTPSATVVSHADVVTPTKDAVRHSEHSEAESALDYWSVLKADITGPKLNLFEQLGTEFGIYQKDYDSIPAYGEAIRIKVAEVRGQPLGFLTITEIEKSLRLNDLGISLDALVDIISNPQGDGMDELDASLEKLADEPPLEEGDTPIQSDSSISIDENGVYSLLR